MPVDDAAVRAALGVPSEFFEELFEPTFVLISKDDDELQALVGNYASPRYKRPPPSHGLPPVWILLLDSSSRLTRHPPQPSSPSTVLSLRSRAEAASKNSHGLEGQY